MDFDWAAWHKKFEDFGISTKDTSDHNAKFPGSFPESKKTTTTENDQRPTGSDFAKEVSHDSTDHSAQPQSRGKQHSASQGWKEEMEEEAADPVWRNHLDKLQASGKLKERNEGYAPASHDSVNNAVEDTGEQPEIFEFSFEQLQDMLTEAESLRRDGNTLYKSGKEIDFEAAIDTYRRALIALPETRLGRAREKAREKKKGDGAAKDLPQTANRQESTVEVPVMEESGLVELTDEQAAALEREERRKEEELIQQRNQQEGKTQDEGEDEIQEVERKIEEIKGFLYGNISAGYVALNKDAEAVEASTKSLLIEPENAKVRLRRAKVNEKIGKFTSLSEALEDYKYLLASLPHSDPRLPQVRRAAAALPARIQQVGKAEMDQMMSQMKDWGDSVLGWFGMKCDDFKTETRPDGSTTININKSE